jgi:hypothetical protein
MFGFLSWQTTSVHGAKIHQQRLDVLLSVLTERFGRPDSMDSHAVLKIQKIVWLIVKKSIH